MPLFKHVFLSGCRNPSQCIASIKEAKPNATNYECIQLDLMSLDSVRQFAEKILAKDIPIHLLANNGKHFWYFKKKCVALHVNF